MINTTWKERINNLEGKKERINNLEGRKERINNLEGRKEWNIFSPFLFTQPNHANRKIITPKIYSFRLNFF